MPPRRAPQQRSKYMKPDGPTSRLTGDCGVDGCNRPQFRQGLCVSHFKRKQRNKPIGTPIGSARVEGGTELGEVLSPGEVAIKMGSLWLEASAEDEQLYAFHRRRFLESAAAWLESLGWQPPPDGARRLRENARRLRRT